MFPSVTSWVFADLNLGPGNIYIFVVTAVSGDVPLSSVLVYFTNCKYQCWYIDCADQYNANPVNVLGVALSSFGLML